MTATRHEDDDDLGLRALAREQLLDRDSERDLGLYIERTSPGFGRPTHLKPVLDLLDRSMDAPVFATVDVPPRHYKTETFLHGLCRRLRFRPDQMCAYTTYSSEFAEQKSRRTRDIAVRGKVPLFAASTKNRFQPAQTVSYWQTQQRGGLLAVGRGGGFTGHGVTGMLVMDDLLKDRVEAESPRVRQDVWDWMMDVAMTRLEKGASAFLVHTRWHEDDPIGRIRKSKAFGHWKHVHLPALAMERDPLGRRPGEALNPAKFSAEHLQQLRAMIGEYSFWSLYQGEPRPRGGKLFGPAQYYQSLPDTPLQYAYGVDMAYTKKSSADYSVCVLMAKTKDALFRDVYYIIHVDRVQCAAPEFGKILQARRSHIYAPMYWRAVGPERGSVDLMRNLMGIPFEVLPTGGDKFVNAQPFAAAWNDKRVLVPANGAPWVEPFVRELQDFTGVGDLVDDQVDGGGNGFDGLSADTMLDFDPAYDEYLPTMRS